MLLRDLGLRRGCCWPSLLLHCALHPLWGFVQVTHGEPQKSCSKVTDSCQHICQCRPPPPLPPPPPAPAASQTPLRPRALDLPSNAILHRLSLTVAGRELPTSLRDSVVIHRQGSEPRGTSHSVRASWAMRLSPGEGLCDPLCFCRQWPAQCLRCCHAPNSTSCPPEESWWSGLVTVIAVCCASLLFLTVLVIICYKAIKRKPLRKEENGTSAAEYPMTSSQSSKGVAVNSAVV